MKCRAYLRSFAGLSTVAFLFHAPAAPALTIDPYYANYYSVTSIGSVPGLPTQYGGLTFLDENTILIGGHANSSSGRLYTIAVVRGTDSHITGFSGTALQYGGAASGIGDYNDGGVAFGPGGVLFLGRWPKNEIGQVKPGTTDDEDQLAAGPEGAASSVSSVNFVPSGFGGAGRVKVMCWEAGQWYAATFSPDGSGTFNIGPYTMVDLDPTVAGNQAVSGGPEGFVYIRAGNALFAVNSMLISEYTAGAVGAYEVDGNGNPLVNTRRTFMSDLTGAEGATIDPVTGDFLFSTFGGGNQIAVVQGFLRPVPGVSPGGLALLLLVLSRVIPRRGRKQ
ncbi:MAG: hypothetical protein HYV63_30415 [Candidatus Schekmanbacteria bacterium]|nr:hypothetical protein [Candidatus Schekmanbacteria bacterium]